VELGNKKINFLRLEKKKAEMLLFPPSYTAIHGKVEDTETEFQSVSYELAFPLVLGDDLQPTAQGFVHHTSALRSYDNIYGLQIAIMCLEDTSQGAIFIRPNKAHQRQLYEVTVTAIAHLKMHLATAAEKELIKKNTVSCAYFSAEHQQDIKDAIERERAKIAEAEEEKKNRKKKQKTGEEEQQQQQQQPQRPTVDILNDARFDVQMFVNLDIASGTCQSGVMPHIGQPQQEEEEEEEEDEQALFNAFQQTTPKALFTLTPMYSNRADPKSKVGYLVRVLVFDPTLNVGDFVWSMIKARDSRAAKKFAPGQDPFLGYADYFSSGLHPVNTITRERYIQVRNSVCNERPDFKSSSTLSSEPLFGVYSHPLHPCNIWTLDRALAKLANNRADITGIHGGQNVARWSAECTFYRYHPAQVFWSDPELIGLSEQSFPDMPLGNEVLRMLDGDDAPEYTELQDLSAMSVVMSRTHISSFMPFVLPYRTRNPILITSCDAEYSFGRLDSHPNATPRIRDALKDHYMKQFCSLFDLESDQSYTDMPSTIKAISKWFRKSYGKTPIDFKLAQYDTSMSLAANLNIKLLLHLERTFKRAQPVLTFMIQFLWSVYTGYSSQSQTPWYYILHGKHGGGKTNATIDMVKLLFIVGTYDVVVARSAKSDTSDDHVDGLISLWDEIPKAFTDPKAADSKENSDLIARFKQVWGTGIMRYNVLELRRNQFTGASERINRIVEKPLKEVILAATNNDITPGDHASIDRFHVEMMKACETPVSELAAYRVSDAEKQAGINLFRVLQSLVAITHQAMSMGAIVREISMDAYNWVKPGIDAYLREVGIKTDSRRFSKVAEVIKTEIIKRAVATVYLFPGGPWFGKAWHPESIRAVEPHLYCTEQDIIFGVTNQYSEFINEDWRNVMIAFLGLLNLHPAADDDSFDMYQLYQDDHPCMSNVHLVYNVNYDKGNTAVQPRHFANLNHLMLLGDLKSVAKRIAEKTRPQIDAKRVTYILQDLENQMIVPPGGAYANVHPDVLYTHRSMEVPKSILTSHSVTRILAEHNDDGSQPELNLDRLDRAFEWRPEERQLDPADRLEVAQVTPEIATRLIQLIERGLVWEPGTPKTRRMVPVVPLLGRPPKKEDLRRFDQAIPMVIIDRTYKGRHNVCIAPCALALTNKQHIISALEHAIVTPNTAPGKRLLGWPDSRDIAKFDTLALTPEYIAAYCEMVGRNEAIYVNNRDRRTTEHNAILSPDVPVGEREAQFRWAITSIDSEAARVHRLRCYQSDLVPIDIQGDALAQYQQKQAELHLEHHGVANYPDGLLATQDATEWKKSRPKLLSSADRVNLNLKRKRG
jgi:hypothetical protein